MSDLDFVGERTASFEDVTCKLRCEQVSKNILDRTDDLKTLRRKKPGTFVELEGGLWAWNSEVGGGRCRQGLEDCGRPPRSR